MAHVTPISPNFPSVELTAKVPVESLLKWPETAAVMVNSPMAPDTSAALTALGDYLVSNGWIEAAHAWSVKMYQCLFITTNILI